jgi:hypothetical protein
VRGTVAASIDPMLRGSTSGGQRQMPIPLT